MHNNTQHHGVYRRLVGFFFRINIYDFIMTLYYTISKNTISYFQVRAIRLITVINVKLNIYCIYISYCPSYFNCLKLQLATNNQTMNEINNI